MNVNLQTSTSTASAVWSAGSRILTTLINGGVNGFSASGSIAAGATLDLRPPSNHLRTILIIVGPVAPGDNVNLGLYNGTTFTLGLSTGGGGTSMLTLIGSSVLGPAAQSTAAVSVSYSTSGWEFS